MPRPVRFTPRKRSSAAAGISAKLRALGIVVPGTRAKPKTEEHDAQVALFDDHIKPRLVAGAVAFAIPNGGHRAKREAGKIKAEGGAAGVPDIFVLHARQSYFLEMKKAKGGRVSPEQRDMMARLVGAGAQCAVAAGLEAAVKQLEAWCLLRPAEAGVAAEEMAA
ncbi:MAG: VRR-NUC domain-containing protein [Beijerinckiaceae bacterium]|nr:VRR-NUC domain-containing protein [Beijerinckiaceae bacterium]